MSLLIESKKLKRTGYLPAFLAGGFLAAAFPVVYMMVKAEEMTALAGNPINILMSANWQMMAMLNILISICGACMNMPITVCRKCRCCPFVKVVCSLENF